MSPEEQRDFTEYSPASYIARLGVDTKIRDYIQTQPVALLSLMGAPGTGKSWTLQDLAQRPGDRLPPGSGTILYQAGQLLGAFKSNHQDLKRELITTANLIGLDFSLDLVPTLAAIVVAMAQRAQKNGVQNRLFVLIDGLDELAGQDDFAFLQEQIRTTFLRISPGFFRVIMARRRPLTNYYLKQMDQVLELNVFTEDEAAGQKAKSLPGLDLSELLPPSTSYQWDNPFINAYLWNLAKSGEVLGPDQLRACCLELVNRPAADNQNPTRFPVLTPEQISSYSRWASRLENPWTFENFKAISERRLEPADLERGIVVRHADSFYKFAPGLDELLRDIATLERGS